MKNNKYILKLAALSLFMLLSAFSITKDEKTRTLNKEFDVNSNTSLSIENKFGDVNIKNWDKPKIDITVTIRVDHPDAEKAQKLLDYISVDIHKEGNKIVAVTQIDDKFSKSGTWFNFGNEKKQFSIDYTVNMPANVDLTLNNRYGDIFINELSGYVNISVKYGNLKANRLTRGEKDPMNQISMGYSKGSVGEINWAKMEMKYSEINVDQSKALIVVSKYSKIFVDKCSSLVSEAKYDTYNIGDISNFVSTAGYTNFKFDKITKKLNLDVRYSDCKVDFVPAGFESIKVNTSYGGIKIGIDKNASYQLKGDARYAHINYPEGNKLSVVKENNSSTVSGLVGNDESTKSSVLVSTNYGNISLTE